MLRRVILVAPLGQIKDNYYLSLVEQELAMQSAFFLGTELSTWSEFIVHVRHDSYLSATSSLPLLSCSG